MRKAFATGFVAAVLLACYIASIDLMTATNERSVGTPNAVAAVEWSRSDGAYLSEPLLFTLREPQRMKALRNLKSNSSPVKAR